MAEESPEHSGDLETLAHKRFGELSEAELRLLHAAPKGDTAMCGPNFGPGKDPSNADNWGSEREIRAGLICWLCVNNEAAKRVDPAGIQVYGAKITGRLNLFFAAISFPLLFQQCRFYDDIDLKFVTVPALNLSGSSIGSLIADGVHVRGDVSLDSGFESLGEVRVLDAQIGGSLSCRAGTFKNPGGVALAADRAEIRGDVLLDGGFSADGEVRLPSVQVGSQLACNGGAFRSLNLQGANVKDSFLWREVENVSTCRLDLTNASTGVISDDEASWPSKGYLFLDGFVYKRFVNSPTDAGSRLKWLGHQSEFKTQPYLQLARVLRETGDGRGAREVLFEMEDRRRKSQNHRWWQRLWDWVLRSTIGYGQMPERALEWLALLAGVGGVLCGLGYLGGAIVPNEKDAYQVFEERGYPPDYYPQFNPFIYSFEHSFPLISLGVKDHWEPAPTTAIRIPALRCSASQALSDMDLLGHHPFRLNAGWLIDWWLWFQVPVGWGLATLFVAGLTGVVKGSS